MDMQPGDPRVGLSSVQLGAVVRLADGQHPRDVASELRVSHERVLRWLTTTQFYDALVAERRAPHTGGRRIAALLGSYEGRGPRAPRTARDRLAELGQGNRDG
jgi:hypothetical protein